MPGAGGDLRRPVFVAALAVTGLVVLVELGLSHLVGGQVVGALDPALRSGLGVAPGVDVQSAAVMPPGSGIAYLALVDGLLLFTLVMLGASLLVSQRAYGRAQGAVTLVVTVVWVLGGLAAALAAFAQLMTMIGLFVAVPFGTIVYLIVWGAFPVGKAALVLGLVLVLKLLAAGLLAAAQPRFLQVKGLMALLVVSVVLQLVLGWVHGFLPGPVVSIGDEAVALVTAVVAVVWAAVMLVFSIPAIVNAVRVAGAVADQPA